MKKCVIFTDNSINLENFSKNQKLILLNFEKIHSIIANRKLSFQILMEEFNAIANQKHNILLQINFEGNEFEIIKDLCITKGYKFAIFDNIRDKNIKEFIYKDTFIKLEHSAMAIILHDDEIVVTYERIYTDTAISLPKGHIEKNETIIDAAIREAKEEAGIIVSRDDIIGEAESYATHYITPNDTEIVKIIYPIIFKINERRSINITEKRIEKVVYMKLKDFYKLCSYSNIRDIVKKIKK